MKARMEAFAAGAKNSAAITLIECGCLTVPDLRRPSFDWLVMHGHATKDERGRFRPTAKLAELARAKWGVVQSRTVAETMVPA